MEKIIERFYFKLDIKQNLEGHFSNNLHQKNYAEKAVRINGIGFIGDFESTWTDELGTSNANLSIRLKLNSSNIYTLHWKNSATEFYGEGFIVDDLFVGDYRNFYQI